MQIARILLILLGLSSLFCGLLLAAKTIFLLIRGVRTSAIIYVSEKGRFIRYRVGESLIDIEYRQFFEASESNTLDDAPPRVLNTDILYFHKRPKFYSLYTFFHLCGRPIILFMSAFAVNYILKYI